MTVLKAWKAALRSQIAMPKTNLCNPSIMASPILYLPQKTIDTHQYWSENAIARKGIQEFKTAAPAAVSRRR